MTEKRVSHLVVILFISVLGANVIGEAFVGADGAISGVSQ